MRRENTLFCTVKARGCTNEDAQAQGAGSQKICYRVVRSWSLVRPLNKKKTIIEGVKKKPLKQSKLLKTLAHDYAIVVEIE